MRPPPAAEPGARRAVPESPRALRRAAARPGRLLADQAFSRAAGAPLVGGNASASCATPPRTTPPGSKPSRGAAHDPLRELHHPRGRGGRQFARGSARRRARACASRHLRLAGRRSARPRAASGASCATRASRCAASTRRASTSRSAGSAATTARCGGGRARRLRDGAVRRARWVGDPARGIEPWRDTGVEMRGPGGRRHRAGVRAHVGPDRRADRPTEERAGARRRADGGRRRGARHRERAGHAPGSTGWNSSSRPRARRTSG